MPDRRSTLADDIRQRIISGLHLGTVTPGARLASTRELAEEFGIAPRTAMAAYRLLEAEGIVEVRERSGIYVAPGHGQSTTMLTQLASWVVDVLLDAREREIPPIAFPERVRRCLETLRLRAACIAGNADQLEQICHELHSDYGIESRGVDTSLLGARDSEAERTLTQADLLVCTSIDAAQVQQLGRQLGKPVIAVVLRPEIKREFSRALDRGIMYLVASDPRFRVAAGFLFPAAGSGANLRVLIVGEDSLDEIPPDAPVHIMGRAHRLLGDTALARRIAPIRRVFADDMAREVLTFVIRANMAAISAQGTASS